MRNIRLAMFQVLVGCRTRDCSSRTSQSSAVVVVGIWSMMKLEYEVRKLRSSKHSERISQTLLLCHFLPEMTIFYITIHKYDPGTRRKCMMACANAGPIVVPISGECGPYRIICHD